MITLVSSQKSLPKNFSRQCSRQNGYRTVTELIQKGHSPVKEWSQNGHRTPETVTGQSQDSHRTVTEQNCYRTVTEHRMVAEGSQKGAQKGRRRGAEGTQKGHRMATGWPQEGHRIATGCPQDGHRMATIQNNIMIITESRKGKESFGPSGKQAR